MSVNGINEANAQLIRFICEYAAHEPHATKYGPDVRSYPAVMRFIKNAFSTDKYEVMRFYCVDNNYRIRLIYQETYKNPEVLQINIPRALKIIAECESNMIIIAHNHPTSSSLPSSGDISSTRSLMKQLRGIDVTLLDHYVVGFDGVTSMRRKGFIHVEE